MEAWERAFRDYIVPQFKPKTLACLRSAILNGSNRLLQGITCTSANGQMHREGEAYFADPVAYLLMHEYGFTRVGEVEDACDECVRRAMNRANCPHIWHCFVAFIDGYPLLRVKAELLRVLDDILGNPNQQVNNNG